MFIFAADTSGAAVVPHKGTSGVTVVASPGDFSIELDSLLSLFQPSLIFCAQLVHPVPVLVMVFCPGIRLVVFPAMPRVGPGFSSPVS